MKNERLLYSIGGIADRYISEAGEEAERRGGRPALLRKTALLVAIVAAAALLCAAGIYAVTGGDLWLQIPAKDPEKVVQKALESQAGKDYTVSIRVESVAVDPEETVRVREQFISGAIAQWRGWSDEYLAEHFVVVKAVYYAEYDHAKTTRSDGDVVMYFYLVRDVDSGNWSIVDNSGNMNLVQSPDVSAPAPSASPGIQEQIEAYLTERFTNKYAQRYDGLHYEMSHYSQTVEDGACTATFHWTMYYLANGWDIGSDAGKEFGGNQWLQVTAAVNEDGLLDPDTILVYSDEAPTGPPDYVILEEYSAPLPRIQWRKQIMDYMSGRYTEKYSARCDGDSLRCSMNYYEETTENGVYTATFIWAVCYPGGDGPYGSITEADFYDLRVTAAFDNSGILDIDTVAILTEDRLADPPDISGPEASAPAPGGPDPVRANDPEEAVRTALEGQVGSEYMVGIQVESAAVDPEETDRVREQLVARGIARRQGWSEEYLAEHFAVVKAFYCAEYDREKTTRGISGGKNGEDVIEYFYLLQNADSGLWSVIDRSGSADSKWEYSAPVPLSWQEQIRTYLSDLFTRAYSPYYDGLHYEMRHYEETAEDGVCTAYFLWTMYHLGKGWDVPSDEGVEEQGNMTLQATAAVDDSGMLDMSTISVMMDVSVNGPREYSFPVEKIFPTQLAD